VFGSSFRPPVRQRAFALHRRDLGVEQFVVHGDLANLGFQPGDLVVAVITFTLFQCSCCSRKRSAQPGGNVTGLSIQAAELAGKRLGLLREVFPGVRRLAILAEHGYPAAVLEIREVQTAARTLGLEVVTLEIRQAEDIALAFEAHKGDVDALYVGTGPLINTNQLRINTLALAARLPTMFGSREYVKTGGLLSYGANIPDLFRRAAEYVDKILRGTNVANLPAEQSTKFVNRPGIAGGYFV
jgi:ABC-type uncharacterized transport system substrate-binding protein